MIKRIAAITTMAILALTILAIAADEHPWFDFEKCEMCKNLTMIPDFMDHLHYKLVKVDNGFVAVTTADPGYVEKYKEVNVKMSEVGQKLMSGEQMYLCGSCQAMGALFMRGAKMQQGELDNGDVMVVTSDDPELVKDIHAFVDKNEAEMMKMMQEKPAEKAKEEMK